MHSIATYPPPAGCAFLTAECDPTTLFLPEMFDQEDRFLVDSTTSFMQGEVLTKMDGIQDKEPGLMQKLFSQAGELGLMGIEIPEAYGGLGLAKSTASRIAESIAMEPSFAVGHNVHTSVAILPLLMFG
ncbi:MAG: acyl-CoA dehydrogenase family protein, partial [Chthonomonadales bacterium]